MAAKYDAEQLMDDVLSIMTTNLNTEIGNINTNKSGDGKGITLSTIDSSAYFFQTMNETTANVNPFVFYGINEVNLEQGIGPANNESYIVGVMLVLEDNNTDLLIATRMLRYLKALRETFLNNWNDLSNRAKLRVESFAPFQFNEGIDSPITARVAAIALHVSLSP